MSDKDFPYWMAAEHCSVCAGAGKRKSGIACNCVYRAMFRECWSAFRGEVTGSQKIGAFWGRPAEEYATDLLLIVRRTLTDDEMRLFRFYFLLRANWRLVAAKLKIENPTQFWHIVYRIQAKVGRALHECGPYALHPVREYFECRQYLKAS